MVSKFFNVKIYQNSSEYIENGYIIVDNGKIVELGSTETLSYVDEFLDLDGQIILPGLIDCNTHVTLPDNGIDYKTLASISDGYLGAMTAINLNKTIKGGVTTIRDIGGIRHIDINAKSAVYDFSFAAPNIYAAGKAICITGGHGYAIGRCADGKNEVIKAVREQYSAGADHIKLIVSGGILTSKSNPNRQDMSYSEIKAGVEEAHRLDMPVAAHCQNKKSIMSAIKAGVDSIEHGIGLDEEAAVLMVDKGIHLVPTLSPPAKIIASGEGIVSDEIISKCKNISDRHKVSVCIAKNAGVSLLMGSDSGTPFNKHGNNRHELYFMCDLGFTFGYALDTATKSASKYLEIDNKKGQLKVGYDAEFIVCKYNPFENYAFLLNRDFVTSVWKLNNFV